ncbi:ribonuclease H [Trifolium pratense]|uniref:Ribonuclease H n=1 Tax=Trifolium pratense TaxID=57577 RepID=A0A2K3PJP0_TRIPR|nr:ribonuclease H [Trifolium pratense]PNY15497.1 ribonuclease H [Trifolium pratense]
MMHSMRRMTGKVGYFAIKVDLTKAYDMIDWSFIHNILREIDLPEVIISAIMHTVTSVQTNVKWNGERANYFRMQRGNRQGDPISPYLFVLCMDKLSHLILEEVEKGDWKTMRAGRHGPFISHLMAEIEYGENISVVKHRYLVDQVNAKLTAWKAKQLSFAGRVTLAKSVIEAIPVYPMMNSLIPKSCIEDIHKIQRGFIWGDSLEKKKFHAVKWENITKPKEVGGLGLRNLHIMNVACLMKLSWELHTGTDTLWCKVMRGKYDKRVTAGDAPSVKAADSALWKTLVSFWPQINKYQFWSIGDSQSTDAWSHCWIKEGCAKLAR